MNEENALMLIFKKLYDKDSKTVTFNAKTYSHAEYMEAAKEEKAYTNFYAYIFRNVETAKKIEEEERPMFDTGVIEIEKITEEQFLNWQQSRKKKVEKKAQTGKEIWKTRKAEEPVE
ncbi:hypothetical protein GINT2_001412 [Glugoides intestinalis]